MFSSTTTTKGKAINAVWLFLIVFVAATAAALIVHIKKDPKNPDGYRNTLNFKKS